MGFRFQKRIRILPGVRINLSKSGVSTSLGGKGLTANLNDENVKTTVGIPGTGLSYSQTSQARSGFRFAAPLLLIALLIIFLIWLIR
jgi:uncharacterized protein DUF4236